MTAGGIPATPGAGAGTEAAGATGRDAAGTAWLRALERAAPDSARLARGRAYARGGGVDALRFGPGRVVGYVRGSRPRPYRAQLRMPELAAGEWDALLGTVAARPGLMAALLDRELPPALVEEAAAAGARLLPAPGELSASCSCPDPVRPCKHAAALAYETARLLDGDPFALLLMRGRSESEILDDLSRRQRASGAPEAPAPPAPPLLPSVSADAARATDIRPPPPEPLGVPDPPGEPRGYPSVPGGPSPEALEFLAADAAQRAYAALAHGAHPLPPLSEWQDAVRLAAGHPRLTGRRALSPLFAGLARAAGHTARELTRAAAAWRQGGESGLAALEEPWDPPAGGFDRARGALAAAGLPRMTIGRNRLTDPTGTVQLRYGHDGRWYPYRSDPGADDWWPEGRADPDPTRALPDC
ncbi:SWIM zinc finger family protein [Streptomyces boncukensis]|uniref:SWIM-type domain-containing protein n=1 Tax=Streptomyces boncukensis TaxID=2711219 RepID=A0A6G4X462_9ACTN|nr:SWIM zinc finger family protein [Streptomyces boncukensis]NGO72305.1 hypothetical protein [Streptomyces boncukensis]